jgi:MFS family permease
VTTSTSVWAPGRRALTVGLVFTVTLVGFEALAIATILKVLDDDLHGIGLIGWVFSAFFLGSLFGVVAAGYDTDRVGPARPFVVGLALFAGGLLAGGVAPNMLTLVIARGLQGIGAGAIPAVAYVAIGRAYPSELQPRMFAVLSTAWVLPGVVGPALSAAIASAFGWRWVFLGLLPLVALAAVMTTRALQALGPPGGDEPTDRRRGALVLVVGAGLVLAGTSVHAMVVAPVLVVIGFVIGVRAFVRLVPAGTLRLAPGLPAAVAIRGLLTFAFFGTDAYVSFTVTDARHESLFLGGIALTAATLTWTAGSWIQQHRVRDIGPPRFVRAGLLLIACGIGLMIAVAENVVPTASAVLAWAVAGLGMGISYSPIALAVLAEAPTGGEGAATSAMQLSDTLGIALGTGISGAIVAAGDSLDWRHGSALTIAFVICATVAVGTALGAGRLPASIVRDRE